MRDVAGNTPFWDNSALTGMKRISQSSNPQERVQAAKDAAQYFEGMFMQMMLKSAKPIGGDAGGGLFKSQALNSFQDMYENQTSMNVGGKGVGLARIIEQQILGKGIR
jgi:flagellar protein FlgJ